MKISYQPKKMLVTGGAGFIGANFIHYILAQYPDIEIINLDKLTYAGSLKHLEKLPRSSQYHFVQGDITNSLLISTLLRKHNIDTIVHFAAESHVDRSIVSPNAFIDTNIIGTFTLLQAAKIFWLKEKNLSKENCRFHHISTDEVFGTLNLVDASFTETTAYSPRSPYAASKAASDHLVNSFFHTYGLPITMSHCSNNYGPYQHEEKFIPTVIRHCYHHEPIPIYGNGKNIRDWLYVEDHCAGIDMIIKHGNVGETYNLGGNNEWENLTLARYICEAFDKIFPRTESYTQLLTFVTDRLGHDFRYAIDTTKINLSLSWQPLTSFTTGIEKTILFYLEQYTASSDTKQTSHYA